MADLKARIGPKHDPQAPFTNKVWVSPALANSKQSPLSRARTTNDPHAFRENHTPSPNSGQLSLIDRLDISPDTNEVNENDPVKYGEEGRAKSLLERVQSKKPSKTPLPSPKQSGTNGVNGRHLTPNSTIAETTNSGGRALTKKTQNKQDVTTSTNNVSNGVHEDVCAHASSSLLPYKNDIHSSAQPIPSSPGAAPSGSRDHSSITPSAQSTRQPVAHASQDSLIKRLSPATPAQATLLPQTFQSAPVRETGLVQPNTQLPSGVDEPYHKNSLNQIRDKVLPLIQKNAAARASATAGNIASYIASTPINHTAISDNCVLTFAQRSSEVNRELLARGISTLPPKPTQMPKQFPVGRGADPIRRISKDFTNDKPSSSHIAHSHSRRGSTEDRRMATMSPQLGAYHAQHDSTETSQRLGRSPPPTHWPSTTVEVHRRSRSPSMFHQRNSSGHPPRYDNLPPRHSRQFSTGDPARRHYKSPSRNPERSASPRRRSSFTSRPDYKRSPERHSYRRNDGTRFDMNNNASEGRGHHDGHPRSDSRRAGSFDGRMDEAPLTVSRSNQTFHYDRRDSICSGHSSPRRNRERRSNSPHVCRRSASPRPQYHAGPAVSVGTRRPSPGGHDPDTPQDTMQTTPTVASPDQTEAHRPTESLNSRTDQKSGLMEDARHADTSNDSPPGDPLPCHNVPGIWFAEYGQPSMSTKLCAFQIDRYTAQRWNICGSEPQSRVHRKLSLRLCCIAKKQFEECVESLVGLPDSSPRQIASAIFSLEKKWPQQGKLIITLNPDTPHKHVWLPHQIGPDYVSIQDFVREGQNIVQLVQLSDLSDFVFALYATNDAGPTEHTPTSQPFSNDHNAIKGGTVTISPF